MPTNPLYVNFKKIHDDFQLLAQKHKQIKSFGMGDTDQMSYWTQMRDKDENDTFESPVFPLLYVVPSTCVNHLQYKTWNYQLIMSDIVDRDLTNQVDVLSDTLQMLQDVVSQFRLSNRPELGCYDTFYDNFPDVSFEPFMEQYSDLTNGWTAQLEITTTTPLDRCAAAFENFTGNTYHSGINYKTIHDDFRLMADHHKQINSFGFGNFEDLSYWTESRLKADNPTFESPYFPLLYVIPSTASLLSTGLNSSFMEYEFNVVCMDIIDRDLVNQIDVLSDTNQILDDVVSQFRLSVERNQGCFIQEYYLDEQITYTPFLEKYSDLCGGWSALIKIKVMTPLDRCNAAFEPFVEDEPICSPILTGNCPTFITRQTPEDLRFVSASTAPFLYEFDSCLPGGIAFNSNTNNMFLVDGCSNYYIYDYQIDAQGCFSATLENKFKIWNTPQYSATPNATYAMAVYDDDNLIIGRHPGSVSQTGSTLFLYNLTTSGVTEWLEVFDNAVATAIYYNTGNTQSIVVYNQASGSTFFFNLYSGSTNPQLLAQVTGFTNSGPSLYFSGNTPIAVNQAGFQWSLDFQTGGATPILNNAGIPIRIVSTIDGNANYGRLARVANPAECYNFDIQYLPVPSPTPSMTPTLTPTATCPITTQYLEVLTFDNTKFRLVLWNQPNFTSPATALCDYTISGCAYGSLGTIYCGTETINQGQHQHQFNLQSVLLPGETIVSFDVLSYSASTCVCPVNLILP